MPARICYEFGRFRLDAARRRLWCDGSPITLTPKTLDLLLILVENSDRMLSRNEILNRVWPGTAVEDGNLTQNISILRKVLGTGPNKQPYIETVPKRGYRFAIPVREVLENGSEVRGLLTYRKLTMLVVLLIGLLLASVVVASRLILK